MEPAQLNPYMLFMDRRICLYSYSTSIMAYDWRLFFLRSGTARIIIKNETYDLEAGDCMAFKGGLEYRFFFDRDCPADMYVINFDLDCACFGEKSRHPVPPDEFNPARLRNTVLSAPYDRVMRVHRPELEEALSRLLAEHQNREKGYREMCSAYLKSILLRIIFFVEENRGDVLVQSMIDYINAHYLEKISGDDLSRQFNYHAYYLGKRFKKQTGQSIHQYVLALRIRKCAELLLRTPLSVAQVAEECGFSSPSYLAEYFKKVYRMTPADYRKNGQLL